MQVERKVAIGLSLSHLSVDRHGRAPEVQQVAGQLLRLDDALNLDRQPAADAGHAHEKFLVVRRPHENRLAVVLADTPVVGEAHAGLGPGDERLHVLDLGSPDGRQFGKLADKDAAHLLD